MIREKFNGLVWEPACGDLAMANVISKYNEVRATDLSLGQDFFFEPMNAVPNIITNPPFKLAEEFIARSKQIATEKIAMLLKLSFLEGQKRFELFKDTKFPLKTVYVFCRRVTFHPKKLENKKTSGMIAFAWYVWDKQHSGPATIDWIKQ